MPSGPFALVFRHFWLICIAINSINGFVWWRRAQPSIAANPELAPGYRRIIRGFVVFGSIPWLVMGVGIVFGGVPHLFHYFNARNGPFVIAWYVSIAAIWLLMVWWLFARNGAEQLVQHPGFFRAPVANAGQVKLFALIAGVGSLIALAVFVFWGFADSEVGTSAHTSLLPQEAIVVKHLDTFVLMPSGIGVVEFCRTSAPTRGRTSALRFHPDADGEPAEARASVLADVSWMRFGNA